MGVRKNSSNGADRLVSDLWGLAKSLASCSRDERGFPDDEEVVHAINRYFDTEVVDLRGGLQGRRDQWPEGIVGRLGFQEFSAFETLCKVCRTRREVEELERRQSERLAQAEQERNATAAALKRNRTVSIPSKSE